jgi:penicillin-binding protein 1A
MMADKAKSDSVGQTECHSLAAARLARLRFGAYEPPVMTRVHAADGQLMAEYAKERRLFLPIQAVPELLKQAFSPPRTRISTATSALIPRASPVRRRLPQELRHRPPSAGRLDHHAAGRKELPADQRAPIERKVKEAILALRIEQAYTKDEILELYLNEIYLGLGAYGVAAASLLYFDKSVHELTLEEAAYLAALPKGPSNYHPFRETERAIERRNWVIDRMVQNGFVDSTAGEEAKAKPLNVTPRNAGRSFSPRSISPKRSAVGSSTCMARAVSTKADCRCAPRLIRSCRSWRARR